MFLKSHLQHYKMLILLILFFLHKEADAADSHLRKYISHKNYYDTARILDPNHIRTRYNGMDYNTRARYTGLRNDIGTSYIGIDNNLIPDHTIAQNNIVTKYTEQDKIPSSIKYILTELFTLVTTKENTLLTDIIDLVKYLETRLPTQLSEVMGLLRAIYVLIHEAVAVFVDQLPKDLSIVNYIFKFMSSVFSWRLIEDITKQLEDGQELYAIPQKMLSKLSADGTFSNNLLASVGEPLIEIVSKITTGAVETLGNITPLLPFEELINILEPDANQTSVNRTSESISTSPGNMYEAYQSTLKLYPQLDELTTGTDNHHLSKSLFKVMTRLLKLIYKSH
ncbi:unnamed protein product [Meganyctiphanes norvegica]|uniref:Uncharacterized protein n=1 Tax=Meganyctiphanes norvegica TaxID=48144 RepID=A0AAV2SL75_MEGNR